MLFISPEETKIIQEVRRHGEVGLPELSRGMKAHRSSLYYQLQTLVKKNVLEEMKLSPRRTVYRVAQQKQLEGVIASQQRELASLLIESARTRLEGRQKLVFSDAYVLPDDMLAQLGTYDVVTFPDSPVRLSPEAFVLRCGDADVVVTFFSVKITRAMLKQCPRLKCIITASLSLEMVDVEACRELGIQIHGLSPHENYKKAARIEFVFSSLFNILRPVMPQAEALRLGQFDYRGYDAQELRGKTVGVVGVNREGREIIPLLRAFGCGVEVCNPDEIELSPSELGLAGYVPLARLFQDCDVVIFPEDLARNITLDSSMMNIKMKTRYFLFLSYSLKLDLDVIRELVISRHIRALALDYFADVLHVWSNFPNSDYRKIMNFPNVVVTPELGFYTAQSMARNYHQVFNILKTLELGAKV